MKNKKHLINIERSTSNGVLPSCKKIYSHINLEDNSKGLIFNHQNMYYLLNGFCNLINLRLLNNSKIYYNNKCKILYYVKSKKSLAQA